MLHSVTKKGGEEGKKQYINVQGFKCGFRCGVSLFIVIPIIYKYKKIGKNRC